MKKLDLSDLVKEAKSQGLLRESPNHDMSRPGKVISEAVNPIQQKKRAVAIVLIQHETTCKTCKSKFVVPNEIVHIRQVNPFGDTFITPFPVSEVLGDLPRDIVTRKKEVPICTECFHKVPESVLRHYSDKRLRALHGIERFPNSTASSFHKDNVAENSFNDEDFLEENQ